MDLFVATRSDRADLLMVGSSANAYKSCELLQRGYCLTVDPVVIFCGAGEYESVVRRAIEQWKYVGGWCEMTLGEACGVICRTLPGRQQSPTPPLQVPLDRGPRWRHV
jgi:hypothetical protein